MRMHASAHQYDLPLSCQPNLLHIIGLQQDVGVHVGLEMCTLIRQSIMHAHVDSHESKWRLHHAECRSDQSHRIHVVLVGALVTRPAQVGLS